MRKNLPRLLSLIIPVYKQEKTVEQNLRQILSELAVLHISHEIIVVIDGMADNSYQEAKKIRSNNLHVYAYQQNHGKGYAVRFGMTKSHGDVVGFIDAGGDISIDSLNMMLEHFYWYNADIIIGSKRHPVSKVHYPLQRKIMSFAYQQLIRILFGMNIRDSQVGMKLMRRSVVEDVMPRLLVKQFAFDIEILAVAYYLGYTRIFESPIELNFTGYSTITSMNLWKIITKMLWDTFAVFYRLKILHYYDSVNKNQWKQDAYSHI